MATDPNPITLTCLPSLAAAPSSSGQKRSRGIPTEGEGKIEDTGASGNGGLQEANASGAADPTLLPTQGPIEQGDDDISPDMAHANTVTAFVASPLLHEPNQLRVDHITTLLVLAVDGPVHKAVVKLLAPAYPQQEAVAIWTTWAPHLAPPFGLPLAGGTLLRDTIVQSMCTP